MTDELFPGFKVSPIDPSREIRPKFTVAPKPVEEDDDYGIEIDDEDAEPCRNCDGWGFTNCFCGGDFCVCGHNGEKPCWNCA